MSTDNSAQFETMDLHEETRVIWDQIAPFWDDRMRDGNGFQDVLVNPASERLLNLQAGESVLEIACGNGIFARRMAQLGVYVTATDFSAQMLKYAQARTTEHADKIEYRLVDAIREEEIVAFGQGRFDAAVCNQGIMDMSAIDPLMSGIRQVVKPGGRFVFALCHPCFNNAGMTLCAEERSVDGKRVLTHAVKVTTYLHATPQKGVGMTGQPALQYYFDRPLHVLFNACFRTGMMLDGLEEPAFDYSEEALQGKRPISWARFREIPPVLVARLRIPEA